MNISTKIGACLSAIALSLGVVASGLSVTPAIAADADGDTIPDQYEASGWWNNASPTTSTTSDKWTYDDYPLTCNNEPSLDAFQVVWITRPGEASTLTAQTAEVRKQFRRAASIYAASYKHVATNKDSLRYNRTPRFVTWEDAGGKCHPSVISRTVPQEVWDQGWYAVWNWGRTTQGFNATNRKYLYVVQAFDPTDCCYGGMASIPGASDSTKSTGNPVNTMSNLLAVANGQTFPEQFARIVAHEIGHSLGAVKTDSPHRNTQNGHHPSDCQELMCYGPAMSAVPGQTNVCGADNFSNPEAHRLDCNKDDYFARNPGAANWLSTHFNIATESTFVWNGATTRTSLTSSAGDVDLMLVHRDPLPLP